MTEFLDELTDEEAEAVVGTIDDAEPVELEVDETYAWPSPNEQWGSDLCAGDPDGVEFDADAEGDEI